MTREEKFRAFEALHRRPAAFVIPNPWDAGTARILSALGFEALATTSAGYAFSIGRLDSSASLTRDDVLSNALAIVESTELPVSADLEDGFGATPECCAETIARAASIGLVGGSIEDATGDPSNPIYDLTLAAERIKAASEVAKARNFVLTARAENFLHGRPDFSDTIRRLRIFAEAGAGVVYAPGLPDLNAIRETCASVPVPVNVVMGLKGQTYSVAELSDAGVKRISVGGAFCRAALGAFFRAAREVKEHGTFSFAHEAMPHAEVRTYMAKVTRPSEP